jgi:hypothetical protein
MDVNLIVKGSVCMVKCAPAESSPLRETALDQWSLGGVKPVRQSQQQSARGEKLSRTGRRRAAQHVIPSDLGRK